MRLPGSNLSLSARVLIGMGLGILIGILFGHWVTPLGGVGDAFILLLQMPVLPYVAVSLIVSLGRLDYKTATELALR
jgi:Na+/H+-dicarboxylate symporter